MRRVAAALLCLAACGPATPEPEAGPADDGPDGAVDARPGRAAGPSVIRPGPVAVRAGHLLLDSAAVDVTGNGALERIELYVEAERWRDGSVLWEDGHHWLLVVRRDRAADDGFVLLDRFVPHGTVRIVVVEPDDASASIVVEVLSGTGGVRMAAYAFDAVEGAFILDRVLEAEGRLLHRTPLDAFR